MQLKLSDFLTKDCGLHRKIDVDAIKDLYPGDYTLYLVDNDGTRQLIDRNITMFLDDVGLYWIEFGPVIYEGYEESKILNLEGVNSSSEAEFLKWCNNKGLNPVKKILQIDEGGEVYLLAFPSNADVLIYEGKIHRIAKLYS